MRLLLLLLMTLFMMLIAMPTFADTGDSPLVLEVEADLEPAAVDALGVTADLDLVFDVPVDSLVAYLEPTRHAVRYTSGQHRPGPNGFHAGIWRPASNQEIAPTRSYASGLALRRV